MAKKFRWVPRFCRDVIFVNMPCAVDDAGTDFLHIRFRYELEMSRALLDQLLELTVLYYYLVYYVLEIYVRTKYIVYVISTYKCRYPQKLSVSVAIAKVLFFRMARCHSSRHGFRSWRRTQK